MIQSCKIVNTSLLPKNQSNIFVYIESSRLAAGLTQPDKEAKCCLKAQAGYFNIIDPKYVSDSLADEWKNYHADQECLINRIIALHEKVKT